MRAFLLRGIWGAVFLLLLPGLAIAQTGTIEGTIVDAQSGTTLPGATVKVQGTNIGTAADMDGKYVLQGVDPGTWTLEATFVGYSPKRTTVEVVANETITVDFELAPDVLGLDEVVVTGVGAGRETKKLGFSVAKVSSQQLEAVPATDAGNALRGKVAGIQVVQASGDPSSSPDIRLRGSTSITGDQSPLIIVDGVITSGGLNDINMQDVESIEVVKGAAASSLYGSLAGNGVIQIRTKRGSESGAPQVTIRSEVGASQVANEFPSATQHPWQINSLEVQLPDGSTQTLDNPTPDQIAGIPAGSRISAWDGFGTYDEERSFNNAYPVLYDNVDQVFTGQPFNTNYVSIANSAGDYSYLASFENFRQGGVLEPVDNYTRNTARLNADYTPTDRFNAKFSASYINVEAPNVDELGQGDNFFYSVLTSEPFMDLTERNEDGEFATTPTGYGVQSSNWQNPLYVAQQREQSFDRTRLIGGVTLVYNVTDWLSVHGRQSIDRFDTKSQTFFPVGYQTPSPNEEINNGFDARGSTLSSTSITEAWTQVSKDFDTFNVEAIVKYLYEDRSFEQFSSSGSRYAVQGTRDLAALDPSTRDIDSFSSTERAENLFLNGKIDYKDKIIVDGLVRRDGSSSFGADERWQTYYRGSIAYRLTEDIEIPNVQELKIRASYGTSGIRPPFSAQYETYSATATGIAPQVLGNANLRPSEAAETEIGLNVGFLNRFNLETNYAVTQVTDDYYPVPLSSAAGFSAQWQNIGELESSAFEVALGGQALKTQDVTLNTNVTFSRVRQEYTDLGNLPPFTRDIALDGADPALSLFRVEEGVSYGAIFGNQLATSISDLTVDADGNVLNAGGGTVDDYTVNSDGYVILAGTEGSEEERPVYVVDENGEQAVVQIGDTQPDFTVGFSSDFTYKGFGVYALLDWTQGGDVYNYTKQLLYFNNRHQDLQDYAAQGKDVAYADGASSLYNGGNATSHFVEDASFVKLREVALSYTFNSNQLSQVFGSTVDRIRLSAIGRNLLTFTDYSGWDPEVGLRSNATNFRLDEYAYPNFRTFTGSVEFRF